MVGMAWRRLAGLAGVLFLAACDGSMALPMRPDATVDATVDAAASDAALDAEPADAGLDAAGLDAAGLDAASIDARGLDAAGPDASVDAGCVAEGALCMGTSVCIGGTCRACLNDGECKTADPARLCYGGQCLVGMCHLPPDPSGCSANGAVCCAGGGSAGTCYSTAGQTSCCFASDCAAPRTRCDLATHTCACPAPSAGQWFVAPTGSDSESLYAGNGSQGCPFKTIGKAIAKTVGSGVRTTITLAASSGAVPNVYGVACTGGPPCDSGPIVIPTGFTAGLTIAGSSLPDRTVVELDSTAVFEVRSPSVSFRALTVRADMAAAPGNSGIVYDAPASPASLGSVVSEVNLVASSASVGSNLLARGFANPTLGPSLTSTGAQHALILEGAATVTVTGAFEAGTTLASSVQDCVLVRSTAAGATPTLAINGSGGHYVLITGCGGSGILIDTALAGTGSTVNNADITGGLGGVPFRGVRLLSAARLLLTNTSIAGTGDVGIAAEDNATLTTGFQVVLTRLTTGLVVSGNASANLSFLSAGQNTVDGVRCDSGSLRLRNTILVNNGRHGANVQGGCAADLGGPNTYNTTASRNGASGLCYQSSVAATVTMSTWSCNRALGSTPPCVAGDPTLTTAISSTCAGTRDITHALNQLSVPSGHTCCSN